MPQQIRIDEAGEIARKGSSIHMTKTKSLAIAAVLTAGIAGVTLAAAGHNLYYHGDAVSHSVAMVNGRPYIPLDDVAHVLGGHVASHDGGYEIVTGGGSASKDAAGGAGPVSGLSSKVGGDFVFTGDWRFRVTKVEHVPAYTFQFAATASTDKPAGPNDELVVVYCTIKNGQQKADEPILSVHGLNTQATAITDDQGQSYPPIDFDARFGSMVPGGSKNYAVIFSVPKSAHLNDIIYTAYGYGASTAKNIRVSLAP